MGGSPRISRGTGRSGASEPKSGISICLLLVRVHDRRQRVDQRAYMGRPRVGVLVMGVGALVFRVGMLVDDVGMLAVGVGADVVGLGVLGLDLGSLVLALELLFQRVDADVVLLEQVFRHGDVVDGGRLRGAGLGVLHLGRRLVLVDLGDLGGDAELLHHLGVGVLLRREDRRL